MFRCHQIANTVAKLQHLRNTSRMKPTPSRKLKQGESWPRKVTIGRETVSVYRRKTPLGNFAYMVANYADGKRRFDSYTNEGEAVEAATTLARRLSETDTKAAQMTEAQAVEYVNAARELQPLGISLTAAVSVIVEAVKLAGDLPGVLTGLRFYKAKHKTVTPKRVSEAVADMLVLKKSRGASDRYLRDLRLRLGVFAEKFPCNVGSVTTADIQAWLNGLKLSTQSYSNYRRVVNVFFVFAKSNGFCMDNPASEVERPKIRNGEIEIFTPDEARRLFAAASKDFIPALALGMFAGFRSAEIERLEWKDIDLKQGHVVIGADKAKTASRRIVPIAENLAEWLKLTPEAKRTGNVWQGGWLYKVQQDTAAATEVKGDEENGVAAHKPVKWKANGCRHSCASYMFALTSDAGRIAGYLGNSAAVIHRHYRELVKPADALAWFNMRPDGATSTPALPQNLLNALPAATSNP